MMSLLSNMLSRFVIASLPRSKHLLISWLQSPSTVNLEPNKTKFFTVSTVSPSICHEVMGQAIRSSWSEPQSAPGLIFADYIELLHLWLQRI